jgi:hypothetical protein
MLEWTDQKRRRKKLEETELPRLLSITPLQGFQLETSIVNSTTISGRFHKDLLHSAFSILATDLPPHIGFWQKFFPLEPVTRLKFETELQYYFLAELLHSAHTYTGTGIFTGWF